MDAYHILIKAYRCPIQRNYPGLNFALTPRQAASRYQLVGSHVMEMNAKIARECRVVGNVPFINYRLN